MATYGAPVLDVAAVTPEMCRQVGIPEARLQQFLGYASSVPVTQEHRDHLGEVRKRKLVIIKRVGILMIVLSAVAIIVGGLTVAVSQEMPFVFAGGVVLGGILSLIMGLMNLCMVRENRKTPTGDITTGSMQTLVLISIFIGCGLVGLLGTSAGIVGFWGMSECNDTKPDTRYRTNPCFDKTLQKTLCILTLIIAPVILILYLITCCSVSCSNSRAFGFKSGYEKLLDLQMARTAEMQRYQQQQQPPVVMYQPRPQQQPGQYQYPPGTYQYPPGTYQPPDRYSPLPQHQQHHMNPSAPLMTDRSGESKSADPPSYYDAMKP